jgi:copper chaperone
MSQEIVLAQNIKCGGCVTRIREGLSPLAGVSAVDVDIATGRVTVTGGSVSRMAITAKLAELGYPEKSH